MKTSNHLIRTELRNAWFMNAPLGAEPQRETPVNLLIRHVAAGCQSRDSPLTLVDSVS